VGKSSGFVAFSGGVQPHDQAFTRCRLACWCGAAGASFLSEFRAVALPENELLLRQQVAGKDPRQLSDLVELFKLGIGVVVQVAYPFADPRPVLLLHVGMLILVPRTGTGEGDLLRVEAGQQVLIE
jgi:hypothetical protein